MFNIIRDSLFYPKGLIKQVNRSGWFIFLYILILGIFMSLGSIMAFVRYENSTFTTESTGCSLNNYTLVCEGENYDVNNYYTIYDMRVFFLNEDMTIDDITELGETSIIIRGSNFSLYFGDRLVAEETIFNSTFSTTSFEDGMQTIETLLLTSWIIYSLASNLVLALMIILISSLMFIKYKQYIRYKKVFKLLSMAITPVALLITIYNILGISSEFFFILGFIAYIPLFRLNKELYIEIATRRMNMENKTNNPESNDDVIETYQFDDVDSKDVDDSDEEPDK